MAYDLILLASLLLVFVSGECPWVYRMIDKDHSYCAQKISVQSLIPTPDEMEAIVKLHNDERSNAGAVDMQKMVVRMNEAGEAFVFLALVLEYGFSGHCATLWYRLVWNS